MGSRDPVFIVGGARSGTTFLGKLLDSHPDVLYRHEPDSVLVNTEIPFVPHRNEVQGFVEPARRYLGALCHVSATKVSGQAPFFDKSYRSDLQKKYFLTGLYLAKIAERLCGPLLRKPLPVADCIHRGADERILYLIKSVDSPWRTFLFSEAMPNLRFIHIVRHPCAVVNSRLRGIQSNLMGSKTYLRPPFEAGMAEGYPFSLEQLEASSYEEKAAFLWMICNQRIHDYMKGREGYRMVFYEDLCRELEPTTRRLFEFAGLSWDPQAEGFIHDLESQDSRETGYFNVMRAPLTALDKWREQLSNEQVERIEGVVRHSELGRRFLNGV
ncbi:MAG: sulfotransferase [Kiloniellaceae bacterium]